MKCRRDGEENDSGNQLYFQAERKKKRKVRDQDAKGGLMPVKREVRFKREEEKT